MKTCHPLSLCLSLLLTACSSGNEKHQEGEVSILFALRCGLSMAQPGVVFQELPALCSVATLGGPSVETDQARLHLSGRSFAPTSNNCSDPSFDDQPCLPAVPTDYTLRWENAANGQGGNASLGYHAIGRFEQSWFLSSTVSDEIGWSSYNPSAEGAAAEGAGIPLELGPNVIQVTAQHRSRSGHAEITVIRVADTSAPVVTAVDPAPEATFGFQVSITLSEQPEPDSLLNALAVTDQDGQPVMGISTYSATTLTLAWRPEASLLSEARYTAEIDGIRDLSGNRMLEPYRWSFNTR